MDGGPRRRTVALVQNWSYRIHRPKLARAVAGVSNTPALLRRAVLEADDLVPVGGAHLHDEDAAALACSENEYTRAWAAARTTDTDLLSTMMRRDSSIVVVAAAAENIHTPPDAVAACVARQEPYSSTCVAHLPVDLRLEQIRTNPELLAYGTVINAAIEAAYMAGPAALRELSLHFGTSSILYRVWDHATSTAPNLASLTYIAERTTARHVEMRISQRSDCPDEWVHLLENLSRRQLRQFAARGLPQNVGTRIDQRRRVGEPWASRLPRSVVEECERHSHPDLSGLWHKERLTRRAVRQIVTVDDVMLSSVLRVFAIEPGSLHRHPRLARRISEVSGKLEVTTLAQIARARGGVELVVSYLQRAGRGSAQVPGELIRMLRFVTPDERLQLLRLDPTLLAHCTPEWIDDSTYRVLVEHGLADTQTRAAFLDRAYLESSNGADWVLAHVPSAGLAGFQSWRLEAQEAAVRHIFDQAGESVETYEMLQSLLPTWKLTVGQLATSIRRLGR